MNKLIIGIGGYKRHGKNILAQAIQNFIPNSRILAFADPLKMEVANILATADSNQNKIEDKEIQAKMYFDQMNCEDIDPNTGKAVKENYRLINQWWGTEFRRKQNPNYWINKYKQTIDDDNQHTVFIAPDCRFPNESLFIRSLQGLLFKVERPSIGNPNDLHESERYVDILEYDWIFNNNSTVESLNTEVTEILPKFLREIKE